MEQELYPVEMSAIDTKNALKTSLSVRNALDNAEIGQSLTVTENGLEFKDKQDRLISREVIVDFDGETTVVVEVSGVTASNNVIVSPNPNSLIDYANAQVRATEQGLNTLTFVCETVPEISLAVNVLIAG